MAEKTLNIRVLQKTDSANNWKTNNPVLKAGEIGYESDTHKVKIGNGNSHWNSLTYTTVPIINTAHTEGETKTLFRASAAATNDPYFAPSDPVYYPLCKLPIIPDSNNYASAHIAGRIGGWESYRVCHIDATITNRAAPSIASLLICNNTNAATLQNSAIGDIFTLTDIVCYTNDDSTVTIYLKARSWFIFDLNIELYQKDAELLFDGTYLSEIPGTESATLSTSQNLLMLANGKAQVKVDNEWKSLVDEKLLNDKVKGFLPFDDTYIDDLNTWQTNGYKKVSSLSTHHPIECRSTDRWGILFFIAENAKNGTGSQIYYPIDGPNVGRMYVRSILVHEPVVVEGKTDENGWYKVIYSTDEIEAASTKGTLTFTGATTGTFNGSEDKTINIPTIAGPKGDKGDTGPEGPQGAQGEQGIPGEPGADGLSIGSVTGSLISGDEAKSTYTVKLTDGSTVGIFQVQNGSKGSTGAAGAKGDKGDTGSIADLIDGTTNSKCNVITSITLDKNTKNLTYKKELEAALKSDLNNYYDSKAIDTKINTLNENITAIPKFAIEVVTSLPTTEHASNTTVYLVKDTSNTKESENLYVEWICVDNTWEKLGEQKVDLTGYATEKWVTDKNYLTTIPAEYITENELSTTLGSYVTDTELTNKKYITNTKDAFDYSNLKGIPTDIATQSWVKTAAKAHDTDLFDGQDSTHYLNYNNLSNKPTIPSLTGYATQSWVQNTAKAHNADLLDGQDSSFYASRSWVQTSARAHQAEDINFIPFRTAIPQAAYSLWPSARANRLSFLPASQILIEESVDGGKTWTDAVVSDSTKTGLFSQIRPSIKIPLKNGKKSCDCMTRVTITAIKFKNVPENGTCAEKFAAWTKGHVKDDGKWVSDNYSVSERYCSLDGIFLWLSSNSDRIKCSVYRSTGIEPNNWILEGEGLCTGWSGSNFLKLQGSNFGGGSTQYYNSWYRRIIFRTAAPSTYIDPVDGQRKDTPDPLDDKYLSTGSYVSSQQVVNEITAYGLNVWTSANDLMNTDRLYHWDANKNAYFPGLINASEFHEAGVALGNKYSYKKHKHDFSGSQKLDWSCTPTGNITIDEYTPEGTIKNPDAQTVLNSIEVEYSGDINKNDSDKRLTITFPTVSVMKAGTSTFTGTKKAPTGTFKGTTHNHTATVTISGTTGEDK